MKFRSNIFLITVWPIASTGWNQGNTSPCHPLDFIYWIIEVSEFPNCESIKSSGVTSELSPSLLVEIHFFYTKDCHIYLKRNFSNKFKCLWVFFEKSLPFINYVFNYDIEIRHPETKHTHIFYFRHLINSTHYSALVWTHFPLHTLRLCCMQSTFDKEWDPYFIHRVLRQVFAAKSSDATNYAHSY